MIPKIHIRIGRMVPKGDESPQDVYLDDNNIKELLIRGNAFIELPDDNYTYGKSIINELMIATDSEPIRLFHICNKPLITSEEAVKILDKFIKNHNEELEKRREQRRMKYKKKKLKQNREVSITGSYLTNDEMMSWIGTKGMQGNNRNVGNKRITKISGKSVYYPKKWR